MKETTISEVQELHVVLNIYRQKFYLFRGQSDTQWDLIPKAGRPPFNNTSDEKMFSQWKRRAKAYIDKESYTEWELLSVAQHTGLPTRLLDWSLNPLVAAFFACIETERQDGAIFVYTPSGQINSEKASPFEKNSDRILYYQPSSTSNRIINQLGHFTIHRPPEMSLINNVGKDSIEKIIIKKEIKKDMIFMLNQYGVNHLTLFPDLEGLSKHLCWFAENSNLKNAQIETPTIDMNSPPMFWGVR